jgi:hypothetical protein
MAMPEATVNKKYGSVFGKYDVGFAWKVFDVQAVPEAMGMEKTPYNHFGLGVLAFDLTHVVASGFWLVNVGHAGL